MEILKLCEYYIQLGNFMVFLNLHLSFQTAELKLKGSPATLTIVSRRCTRRLGTRMWRRGANLDGDVANFIETEQLVEIEGFQSSLLQIRGSIPLLWEQIVDLSDKPQLRIIMSRRQMLWSAIFLIFPKDTERQWQ
ncbi:unnamed protein product [Malus baccata var. baccata]